MAHDHTVLIGAAGTATAFGAISSLRRHWSGTVRIVATDINPRRLVTSSLLSDEFEQVPLAASSEFPGILAAIVRRHGVDIYLPLLPEEMVLAARMKAEGSLPESLTLVGGRRETVEIASDKWLTAEWLGLNGLPSPRTAPAHRPFLAERYFLKPRVATGSRGARLILAADLGAAVEPAPDTWIVQEPGGSPEVTVDAFYDPTTDFSAHVCRERIEIKSGVTTKARLFENQDLARLVEALARALPFAGSFCFQTMRFGGRWAVIDLNLRPGAATAMSAAVGNDFFAATFARCWGQPFLPFFRRLEREVFVTRQYAEFITG